MKPLAPHPFLYPSSHFSASLIWNFYVYVAKVDDIYILFYDHN